MRLSLVHILRICPLLVGIALGLATLHDTHAQEFDRLHSALRRSFPAISGIARGKPLLRTEEYSFGPDHTFLISSNLYDPRGRLVEEKLQIDSSFGLPSYSTTGSIHYIYNQQGNLARKEVQTGQPAYIFQVIPGKQTFTYNHGTNIASEIFAPDGQDRTFSISNTFGKGNRLEYQTQTWKLSDGCFESFVSTAFSYSNKGWLTEANEVIAFNCKTPDYLAQTTYHYDAQGNIIFQRYTAFRISQASLVYTEDVVYMCTARNLLSHKTLIGTYPDGSQIVTQYDFTYDQHGNLISAVTRQEDAVLKQTYYY